MLKKYDKNGTELNLLQDVDIESGDGFIKYPDGTMIQWGSGSVAENSHSTTIEFYTPFFGEPFVIASPSYTYEITVQYVLSNNDKNFTFYREGRTFGITKPQAFSWHAIGRWK